MADEWTEQARQEAREAAKKIGELLEKMQAADPLKTFAIRGWVDKAIQRNSEERAKSTPEQIKRVRDQLAGVERLLIGERAGKAS